MYELILANIAKHIILDKKEGDFLISLLHFKRLSRKETVLKEGELCKHINFVNSGTLRAFYVDTKGKESTIMFAQSGWWITDMFAYANQKHAMLNIEALEDSVVLQLEKSNLDLLLHNIPALERFFRIIFQNAYIREQLRVIENLSEPAGVRYANFTQKYPHIIQQVTQKQIASYLGITPEFLSMIRKDLSRE